MVGTEPFLPEERSDEERSDPATLEHLDVAPRVEGNCSPQHRGKVSGSVQHHAPLGQPGALVPILVVEFREPPVILV